MSEASKVRPIIQKYLEGKTILDIGCGMEKITPTAIGIDMRYPTVADAVISPGDIYLLHKCSRILKQNHGGLFDVVFSSHCLEHLADWEAALISWEKWLKDDGLMILYLPDDRYYNNLENKEHVQIFTYEWFRAVCGRTIIDSGLHVEEGNPELYSFWVVMRKKQ